MFASSKTIRWLLAASCVALVLVLPGESQACWFCNMFTPAPAPVACAPTCAPTTTQVGYVPQVAYRTVYSPVAVTTYRPVTACDPCSGTPVTTMSPVTTYVNRPVVVPYTTYRPVYTTVQMPVAPACGCSTCGCSACSACSGGCASGACGTPATSYYQPSVSYYQPAVANYQPAVANYQPAVANYQPAYQQPAAPSCGCGAAAAASSTSYYSGPVATAPIAAAPITSSPAATYVTPGPATNTPVITVPMNAVPSNVAPSINTPTPAIQPSSDGAQPTFAPTGTPNLTPPAKPVPDIQNSTTPGASAAPRLLDPNARTTSMPIMRQWPGNSDAPRNITTAAQAVATDADGWHAAR